jgi:hypothetical protein
MKFQYFLFNTYVYALSCVNYIIKILNLGINYSILAAAKFIVTSPPAPHSFNDQSLQSSIADLTEIVSKVNDLLPQFSDFINQFNNIIVSNNINIIIETTGRMALDVPASMPDSDAAIFSQRIAILDRIILTRIDEIEGLIEKGLNMETQLKKDNVNFTSQILDKANEFKKLKDSYKY